MRSLRKGFSEPGALVRTEDFTRAIPEGAMAWRILYTTTRDEGVPLVEAGSPAIPELIDWTKDRLADAEPTSAYADD